MAARPTSPLRIGYFGRARSFSHVAAERRFPQAALSECPTVEDSFARLQAGEFSHILVPIENASSGIITNTADQLMRLAKTDAVATLQIREALAMRVELMLMARPDTETITKIYSHRAPFDHSFRITAQARQPGRGHAGALPSQTQPDQNSLPPHSRPLRGVPLHDRISRRSAEEGSGRRLVQTRETHRLPRRYRKLCDKEDLSAEAKLI
jgi:hypothetical protein